jgi:hypothetical protein
MQRGVTVGGLLSREGLPATLDLARVRVHLDPVLSPTDWEMAPHTLTLDADGRFSVRNVLPAQYRIRVSGLPEGWSIDSAIFDEKDAADLHLQVDGGRDRLGGVVKVTARRGEVSGTITSTAGKPVSDHTVLLFPSTRAFWVPQSRRIQFSRPGPDGRYAFGNLPAGDYRIVALLDPEPGRHFDPEWLTQLMASSIEVVISEGAKVVQDVRIR